MIDDYENNAAIRRRVERNFRRRLIYALHLVLFVGANGGMWLVFPGWFWSWMWFLLAGSWFLVGICHTVWLFFTEMKEWTIRREIERESWLRAAGHGDTLDDKLKRGSRLVLSDDGEVVEMEMDDNLSYGERHNR